VDFDGVTELLPFYEALEDGAEIMWADRGALKLSDLRQRAASLQDVKPIWRVPIRTTTHGDRCAKLSRNEPDPYSSAKCAKEQGLKLPMA
jgi:hypothetical protein